VHADRSDRKHDQRLFTLNGVRQSSESVIARR
jgi:hypothetical protein